MLAVMKHVVSKVKMFIIIPAFTYIRQRLKCNFLAIAALLDREIIVIKFNTMYEVLILADERTMALQGAPAGRQKA